MPAIVTLDIFSGLPNPMWVIDDDQLERLRAMGAGRAASAIQQPWPVLGYRGFTVEPVQSPERPLPHVEGFAETPSGAAVVGHREAERFLLSTAGPHLNDELKQHVSEAIERGIDPAVLERAAAALTQPLTMCPTCHAADAPAYNPDYWNNTAHIKLNNCYNYANNQRTDTLAQPGLASGHTIKTYSCNVVQPYAVADGLKACANFSGKLKTGQGWYVALVIWPNEDYHWYRQDTIGCWSHKRGKTPAINTDNSGKGITDPKTCNRGDYTAFCTYMITTSKVRIR